MSADPVGVGGGINRFAYCSNNPVGRLDRGGQEDEPASTIWGNVKAFGAGFAGSLAETAGAAKLGLVTIFTDRRLAASTASEMVTDLAAGLVPRPDPEVVAALQQGEYLEAAQTAAQVGASQAWSAFSAPATFVMEPAAQGIVNVAVVTTGTPEQAYVAGGMTGHGVQEKAAELIVAAGTGALAKVATEAVTVNVGARVDEAAAALGRQEAQALEASNAPGPASRITFDVGSIAPAAPGEDVVVLGQYKVPVAFEVAGELHTGVFLAEERILSPTAMRLRGRTLAGLPGQMEKLLPEIERADRVVFFTSEGMGPLTTEEMAAIQASDVLREKTTFVIGAYPQ